ncbi:MAG: protease modulator HflC [bacterium]
MGMTRLLRYLLLGIVIFFVVSSIFYQIHETQIGVITQFGKPIRIVNQSGLHVKWLYPFQRIHKFDRRLLTFDPPSAEFLTKDKKNLNVDAFMLWEIKDPVRFFVSVGNRVNAETRLADLLYSAVGTKIGQEPFSTLISYIPGEMNLAAVCQTIEENCRAIAAEDFGINVRSVLIKRITYPPQNRIAVFERMKAERSRIARLYRSEGEEGAQKIRSSADLEAALILAEANQTALTITGASEARAAEIYRKAIQQDPEFYRFLRSLDAYKAFMNERTTIVLPNNSELLEVLRKGPSGK